MACEGFFSFVNSELVCITSWNPGSPWEQYPKRAPLQPGRGGWFEATWAGKRDKRGFIGVIK